MGWRAEITEKIKSCLGDCHHVSGEESWKPGLRHEPVPHHISLRRTFQVFRLEISVLRRLHRSLKSRWRRASTATTTRIGSLPVYPNSSDPGYAGRRSSKSQMGRSVWLEQEWRLRISCTRCITQSQQTKKVKSASLHKEMHKSTVPEWALVMSMLQVVFLRPTSSCHTALNTPTKHSEDAQIAARLTAQLSRKTRSQSKWGLSFPSFLSNASNVGYLRSRRPACYHHLVLISIFLWQLVHVFDWESTRAISLRKLDEEFVFTNYRYFPCSSASPIVR